MVIVVTDFTEGEDEIDGLGSQPLSGAASSTNTYWTQKRKDEEEGDLKYEFNRLETFLFWPEESAVSAEALAQNGFYFIGPAGQDRVRCVFCEVVLKEWEPGDVVSDDHKKFSKGCPFVCGASVGNVPFHGPYDHWNPFNKEKVSWKKRLISFRDWPKYIQQRPRVLAASGFYYKGRGDIVQCFCCGGIVRQWLVNDDPWLEHMKHFPTCYHIQNNIAYHKMPTTLREVPISPTQHPQPAIRSLVDRQPMHRSTSEIALEMGYSMDLIAIYREYLRKQNNVEAEDPNEFILDLERFKVQPETQPPGHFETDSPPERKPGIDRRKREESVSSFCESCGEDEPDSCYVVKLDCGHNVCCEPYAINCETCAECKKKVRACLKVPLQVSQHSRNVNDTSSQTNSKVNFN